MTNEELLARANAHREHNRGAEKHRGTGFHDEDMDWKGKKNSPQAQGLPRISEHLFPFFDEYDVVFVGPCAEKAFQALQDWYKAYQTTDLEVYEKYTGTDRKLLQIIPKQKLDTGGKVPRLTLRNVDWNAFLHALTVQGIGLSGAPMKPDGTTPGTEGFKS